MWMELSYTYRYTSSTRTSRGRKFPVYKKKHKPIRTSKPIEKKSCSLFSTLKKKHKPIRTRKPIEKKDMQPLFRGNAATHDDISNKNHDKTNNNNKDNKTRTTKTQASSKSNTCKPSFKANKAALCQMLDNYTHFLGELYRTTGRDVVPSGKCLGGRMRRRQCAAHSGVRKMTLMIKPLHT